MSFSLNEVDATAKKATRGVGYSWGLAEEAGKAARWLAAHDLDGCDALAGLLEQCDGTDLSARKPNRLDGTWTSERSMCPLLAGSTLSDMAYVLKAKPITMERVAWPLLLLPFAASAALQAKVSLSIHIDETIAVTDGRSVSLYGRAPALAKSITIKTNGAVQSPQQRKTRLSPDTESWVALIRFAHRTYAPATEESRLLGAGAGLSDND